MMRGSAKKDRHVTFQNNGSQLLDIPHAVAIESGFFKKNSHLGFPHNGSQLLPRTPNFKVVIQTPCSRPSKKTAIFVRTSNSHNFNIDVRGRGGLVASLVILCRMAVFFEEPGEVFSHSHVHALVNKHRDNPTMVHVKGHRHPHL